jgi:hypothetical protein
LEDDGCSAANSVVLERTEHANWQASGTTKGPGPVGGGFGKIFRIGKLPFNVNVGDEATVVRPDQGTGAEFRLQCSPTRAALLSGHNHHTNNMGGITEIATAFPGHTGQRPNSVAPLAEMLRLNGYSTAAFGKSHETTANVEDVAVFDSRTRRHSTRGYKSPIQFLDNWRMAQHQGTLVA